MSQAMPTPTTPAEGQVIYVSRNFAIDTATRELGEAHPVLKIADDNLRQFEKCLARVAPMIRKAVVHG